MTISTSSSAKERAKHLATRVRTARHADERLLRVPADFAVIVAAFTTATGLGFLAILGVLLVIIVGALIFTA